MGGVDRSDQNIGQYRITIRGKKWYFSLLCHAFDMCVQNSWHIHKANSGRLDQLSFRRTIAVEMLKTYKRTTKVGPSKPPKYLHEHSRFNGVDHLIEYQESQRRCAVCHKKSNFMCFRCTVALHPKECFFNYHKM